MVCDVVEPVPDVVDSTDGVCWVVDEDVLSTCVYSRLARRSSGYRTTLDISQSAVDIQVQLSLALLDIVNILALNLDLSRAANRFSSEISSTCCTMSSIARLSTSLSRRDISSVSFFICAWTSDSFGLVTLR